jgi:GNAT superfamily N-acetyltransferase
MTVEIQSATEATLAEVEAWLDMEEAVYQAAQKARLNDDVIEIPIRGFRCNWDTTKRLWREGDGRVDVLVLDGETVGFLAGYDILEIRPARRGAGYGRILAEHMLRLAQEAGRSVLEIEIAPSSAEPFWTRMGFTPIDGRQGPGGGIYAYKFLPRLSPLGPGARVRYEIAFYTQAERYAGVPRPFARYSGLGERLPDGTVGLPERAVCFNPNSDGWHDDFVRIELDGRELHFEKVKRDASRNFGVQRDDGYIYYLDHIEPYDPERR